MKKFKNKAIVSVFFWIITMLTFNGAEAQTKWGLSFRPEMNFNTESLGDANLDIGYGFDATIRYQFYPHVIAFAGWSFSTFSADKSFAGIKSEFDCKGYNLGLQFSYPIADSKFQYIFGAGVLYHYIEVENYKRQTIADSKYGFGWQVEAGFSYKILKNLDIMPTVRYRSLSSDIRMETMTLPVHLNYISVGAEIIWSFRT